MCGICGVLGFDGRPADRDLLTSMTRRLAHRGPNGEGDEIRGSVGLGHRRLSIIDLATGQQPMFNEDRQVAVTYNGEIYNYRELAAELKSLGHVFHTKSDTEVIVHAWEQWGKACVERFRGMFAFAVADWRQKVLFLARDHFGIKPLYYTGNGKRFAFASELQALRCLPDFPSALDLEALDQYLFLYYIPAPRTIFEGVCKLEPAHRMIVHFDGRTEAPERYWRLAPRPSQQGSLDDWAAELEEVLRESVKAHLVAEVPFGAFLSGGMDSSVVVGLMAQEMSQPVRTFSIGFEEADYSELEYARQVSKRWATDHHEYIVRPNAMEILPDLVRHYGEPFGDSSAIPTYYVSKCASESVPMVLSGDGGDEALGGYNSYRQWLTWLAGDYARPRWKEGLRPALGKLWPARFGPNRCLRDPTLESWQQFVQGFDPMSRRKLWRQEYRGQLDLVANPFDAAYTESRDLSPLRRAQYMDYQTYLPNDILAKVDIASMMHGLEVRTPLIDVRVAEFAATIPDRFLLARDATDQWVSKIVLRKILSRHFPDSFINRPKCGFEVPISRWFRPGGALRGELQSRLTAPSARIAEYFEPSEIAGMIAAHGQPRDLRGRLWLLFFLENWLAA